jgi:NitT/TauT family transport system substrate-binding protein
MEGDPSMLSVPARTPGLGHRRGRALALGLATATAALASAACAGCAAPSPGSAPAGLTHLTVGALPIVDDIPVYLAQQRGYFRREGLDVTIRTVAQSTTALPDLLHGSVDIITGANYVSFFRAQAHGLIHLRILADGEDCLPGTHVVLALPHSGVTTPADLAGKTVAVNILDDVQTMLTDETLYADDVHTLPRYVAIPFADMPAALARHQVQAIYEVEPYLSGAENTLGADPILDTCTGMNANLPIAGAVTTAAWAQRHPGTARAFQRAMAKAAGLADTDRAAAETAIATYLHVSPQIAALVKLDSFPASANPVQLQRMAQHMQSAGLLAQPLNVAALIVR